MANPVRVQREESFQTSGPPAVLTVGYVHPDDLARAIREGAIPVVDERIRAILRGTLTALDRVIAAPRAPAQERQEAPEPPQHAEAMADLLRELEGWNDGPNSSDDTRRKHWLMRRAAATIRALTPPTPTPDPLLPGQDDAVGDAAAAMRRVADYLEAAGGVGAAERADVLRRAATVVDEVDAEIARREGGA